MSELKITWMKAKVKLEGVLKKENEGGEGEEEKGQMEGGRKERGETFLSIIFELIIRMLERLEDLRAQMQADGE